MSNTREKSILFLYNIEASWIKRDLRLLRKHFDVTDFCVSTKMVLFPWTWIINTLKADIIFLWFGSLSFLPIVLLGKILNKKIVIVAGGFDVAKDYKFSHGAFNKPFASKALRKLLFRCADKIIAVSKSTEIEAIKNAKVNRNKVELIYHGFENPNVQLCKWEQRLDQAVMISNLTKDRYYIKGADQFIKIANALPEIKFLLVGEVERYVLDNYMTKLPSNISLLGKIPFGSIEFDEILNKSKIVLQLSHYESFGAAVVDGALRGCYPIVYDQFALSEVVGKVGKKIKYGEIEKLAENIEEILANNFNVTDTQTFYLSKFNIREREKKLITVMNAI